MSSVENLLKKVSFDSLDTSQRELLHKAVEARLLAYAPYSKFKVGACVLCEDGTIFTGCNVENSASCGICAERTAYVKAVSEGKLKFKTVAVIAHQERHTTTPCGVCRQFMSEFGDVSVLLAKPNLTEVYVSTLNQLLPCQFGVNKDFTY